MKYLTRENLSKAAKAAALIVAGAIAFLTVIHGVITAISDQLK